MYPGRVVAYLSVCYNRGGTGRTRTPVDAQTSPGHQEYNCVFNPLNSLLGLFSLDIGIDLGTANTLVSVRGKGIVINEPSVVAIEAKSKRVVAIGLEAKQMVGRTPANIVAIRPLRDGVISDFDVTEKMLVYFIRRVHQQMMLSLPRPRVVVGIPSGCTEVEKRAVYEASLNAGAREAYLIEEPMAAAIGANLPVTDSVGSMVVDIGGGTTEVAVIALGGIVVSRSIRVAGDEMDEEIIRYAREKYNLLVGERMAEKAKMAIGSAYPLEQEQTMLLRGRNLLTGLPQSVEVSSVEIREALSGPVHIICDAVRNTLDETPPELVADLMEHGIALVGGGALLQGLSQRLAEETRMKVVVAEEPLTCVAKGAGRVLEELDTLRKVLSATHRDGRWG
ncbi:MAG: rod shape-determining protein [Anaerolineae bacterium]|nr:rod shape-determining protein [Anaerolineae bacterium]